eukprot:g8116.t1
MSPVQRPTPGGSRQCQGLDSAGNAMTGPAGKWGTAGPTINANRSVLPCSPVATTCWWKAMPKSRLPSRVKMELLVMPASFGFGSSLPALAVPAPPDCATAVDAKQVS